VKAFEELGVPIHAEPENGVPGGEATSQSQIKIS
jgi:hypothetical protein